LAPDDRQEALRLTLAAEAAMPPNYSRESDIRCRIIELEEELSRFTDIPGLDEKDRERYRVDVLMRRRTAVADGRSDSRQKMIDLAGLAYWELHLGLLDDADKHYREALSLGWQKPIILFYRNYSPDDAIILALIKAGREKEAESLLLFIEKEYEAHAKDSLRSGQPNFRIAEQIAKRFTFLVEQNRFDEASALLTEILADVFPYADDERSRCYLFDQLNETFESIAKSNAVETRLKALNWAQQLLAWQLKHYDVDDYRVCNTQLELAILNERNANWSESVDNYASALSTAIKYGAKGATYTRSIEGLQRIATALTSQPEANDKLLDKIKTTLVEAKKNSDKIRSIDTDPGLFPSEYELRARLATLKDLAPFSDTANNNFVSLSQLYEKNENWAAIPALVSDTVKYQRHTSPVISGGCWQGNGWSYTNRTLILLAVKALLKTSTPAAATNFLKELMQILKEEATFDDYANNARAADLIGDPQLALNMWKIVVDRAATEADTYILEREAIPSLVRLKADDQAARAKEIIARLRNESSQRRSADRLTTEARMHEGLLPAPVSASPYTFNYAALASKALSIDANSRLLLYDGPGQHWWSPFAGSFGTFQTTEPVLQSNNLKFVYHGTPESLGSPTTLISVNDFKPELVGTRFFYGPPPVPKLPFAPPPAVPRSAKRLVDLSKQQTLKPGDYFASSAVVTCLDMMEKGRIRLFISDTPGAATGLTIGTSGRINGRTSDRPFDERGDNLLPYQFEIWYGGKKPVRMEKGADYNGTIYAPEADVILDDAQIHGAVIARTISLKGRSAIYFVRR